MLGVNEKVKGESGRRESVRVSALYLVRVVGGRREGIDPRSIHSSVHLSSVRSDGEVKGERVMGGG
jgi:hypothetical protein